MISKLRYANSDVSRLRCHGILTAALGIGANTAIFTLVHAILLKSLPVANRHFQDTTPVSEELAAFQFGNNRKCSERSRDSQGRNAEHVSGNYFTFGLGAYAGRMLLASDDGPGAPPGDLRNHDEGYLTLLGLDQRVPI